jgi:hypothetical protein
MTNSLVHSLEGYVLSVFQDIKPTYRRVSDWERDKNRSLHELAIRGERFLTIDLPAIRKHFEKCLEEGLYVSSGVYLSGSVSKKVVVPAYLRDLYLQIFQEDGKLRHSPNIYAIADLRQWFEGFGKLKHRCKEGAIDDEVKNFITIENEIRRPCLNWLGDDLYHYDTGGRTLSFEDLSSSDDGEQACLFEEPRKSLGAKESRILQQVCDILSTQLGDFHNENPDELPKHGAGRVSNLARTECKFSFRAWPRKLDRIFPYDRYAVPDYGVELYLELTGEDYSNAEHPSKLCAVPKTMSGPRLIASEPNYHQWIQQLVRNQIEARVGSTILGQCITFGDQTPNRRLALIASANQQYCTVDLKSASDRLSCWTVERAFRANITLLERIHACRTRMMVNSVTDTHFGTIVLKKCFTQGSACTFPVQTLVYSMLAIASVLITEGLAVTESNISACARKVRVFGDDIIVPTNALRKLLEVFELVELKVNLTKTFSKGKFRESCGLDAYDGVDVTPARVRRFSSNPSHETAASMLESSNNLFKRGMWNTANWLLHYLRGLDLRYVSPHDSDGIVTFCGRSEEHLKRRYNERYHRFERKTHVLVSKSKVIPSLGAHSLMQYLHKNHNRKSSNLDYLVPKAENSLGVVDKTSSVMSPRWVPESV